MARNVLFVFILAVVGVGCAAQATSAAPVPLWAQKQCWVDGNTTHMYAVGSSNFRNPIARRGDAELNARAALAECIAGHVTRESDASGTTTRSSADADIGGSQIATHWVDPSTGVEYALAVVAVQ